jgi:NADH dehydrogenase
MTNSIEGPSTTWTKAELYARARELDIDGRSGMTKAELIGALQSAGKSQAAGKSQSAEGVLVVGGGYAGVHAARSVIRAGHRAFIVDPTGRHDFVTRLAAVAGGTAPVRDASAALSDFSDDVIIGSMESLADGVVTLDDGRVFSADAVVVTAGAAPTKPPIPGIEFASPLRTADDALELRTRISASDSVVIVGGGATGVQLAGSIAARHHRISVTLVEGADSLLAGMNEATGADAARILRSRGVDIRLGSDVDEIGANSMVVAGETIVGLPIWAAGFAARAGEFGAPVNRAGQIEIDKFLRVRGWERTFAAGDVAAHRDGNGHELSMSAQIAVQAGDLAGRNAARLLGGDPLEQAQLAHRGWVLDLSGHRGLAEFGPVSLSAPFFDLLPPLLHWGIDVKHLIDTRGLGGLIDAPG